MGRLNDKVAIVTGGSNGIGRCICETFAREGAKVVSFDVNELPYECVNVEGYKGSVTDREAVADLVSYVEDKYEKIDILVNNAGITRDALTQKITEEMWDLVVDINLKGTFNLGQAVGPFMMEQGSGSIINIASVVGEYGNIGQANYAATKAGVIGLAKTWAKEFARKGAGVRCNVVAPGYTMTDMMKTVPETVLEPIREKTMLRRLAEPQEIANGVLFLASDEASYITGHVLSINGGLRL
ncbi:3-oxoacyl-ACP reductase FabG [Gudongella oleilytica]|jgi:3-oxoacyl-[acyl-carrier protein] reductase|uniref:3-oxoacyl-ACP reductase FabG n=1 Tax=Gudongella oleilytica TaxID=1582259 RepID=UPI002A36149E|nr:3-oxoacyl-ACP reductase FabG [Gudongella oleilytica]MDY0257643.1 3-oxoacyl-ACP reductase FabG [Gudongella oleilytica]